MIQGDALAHSLARHSMPGQRSFRGAGNCATGPHRTRRRPTPHRGTPIGAWAPYPTATPVLSRTISSTGTTGSRSGESPVDSGPSNCLNSKRSAIVPISEKSVRIVVSGGSRCAASGMSS